MICVADDITECDCWRCRKDEERWEREQGWHAELDAVDDESLPLSPYCPHCGGDHDIGEIFSGGAERCDSCGALLQAYDDGQRMLLFVEKQPPARALSGRQRTRALWRKRGRR